MRLLEDGQEVKSYPVSTSKYGLGTEEGSNKTPLGRLEVTDMIGDGAPPGTIFKGRKEQGVWDGTPTEDDLVLTRILRLGGRDPDNANTRDRYIYIHGTNQEKAIGAPASHGCVRMTNADVADLYARVNAGTAVEIIA